MASKPEPSEPPEHDPSPPPAEEPDWARNLRESIEALPGKLRASVSDDDKRGIAEHVHGLFEQSGAFVKEPEKKEPEPEPEGEPDGPHGDKAPEKDTLARRLFGPH